MQGASVRVVSKVAIVAIVLFGIAVVDHPSTVGLKALVINLLPIEAAAKAELVLSLCQRALPAPPVASLTCFQAHSSEGWLEAYRTKREGVRNTNALCSWIDKALAVPNSISHTSVTFDDGNEATLIDDTGRVYAVNRDKRTISFMRGGLMLIECTGWPVR